MILRQLIHRRPRDVDRVEQALDEQVENLRDLLDQAHKVVDEMKETNSE